MPETRWQGRPLVATVLRVLVFLVPALAGLGAAWGLAALLPRPEGVVALLLTWLALVAASTVVIVAVERVARRLLPLAFLLDLSLLFPGEAPSRFRVALRTHGVRDLRRRLEQGAEGDDPVDTAETILGLVAAISGHDRRTRGHSERVRAYAELIGGELGLPEPDLDRLRWAALLHDVGKLTVPGEVLNKPGEPEGEEWELIRRHPVEGARLAAPLRDWLGDWAHAIDQHHEHVDGTGYPNGLSGDEIALAARIVAVADAYETMTALRSYNRPRTPERARAELARCSGTHFDPRVVRAFLALATGRVRRVAGPFVWLAELPMLSPLRVLAVQPAASAAGTVGAVGLAALTGLAGLTASGPDPAVADDGAAPALLTAVPRDAPGGEAGDPPAPVRPPGTAPDDDASDAPEDAATTAGATAAAETASDVGPGGTTPTDPVQAGAGSGAGTVTDGTGAEPDDVPEPDDDRARDDRRPRDPPDPPGHANADPDPDTSPGTPADPDPHGDDHPPPSG